MANKAKEALENLWRGSVGKAPARAGEAWATLRNGKPLAAIKVITGDIGSIKNDALAAAGAVFDVTAESTRALIADARVITQELTAAGGEAISAGLTAAKGLTTDAKAALARVVEAITEKAEQPHDAAKAQAGEHVATLLGDATDEKAIFNGLGIEGDAPQDILLRTTLRTLLHHEIARHLELDAISDRIAAAKTIAQHTHTIAKRARGANGASSGQEVVPSNASAGSRVVDVVMSLLEHTDDLEKGAGIAAEYIINGLVTSLVDKDLAKAHGLTDVQKEVLKQLAEQVGKLWMQAHSGKITPEAAKESLTATLSEFRPLMHIKLPE